MKKAGLAVGFLMITSVFLVTLTILPGDARAATHYVGGSGPGNYTTIQEAIDDAGRGDIIFIYNGTYSENLEVYKTSSLIGEDRNTTIIDGGGTGDVVSITADWVNITGFSVLNSGQDLYDAGIELYDAQNCNIANNRVLNNWRGIYLRFSDTNAIINNTALNNKLGISLSESRSNMIANNTASSNYELGINIRASDWNIIINNMVSGNDIYGIVLARSRGSTVANNVMVDNGIHIAAAYLLQYWNTHTIEASNTVNGEPVYYWKNVVGGIVPSGAGQVILANCSGVRVENQNVSNGTVGIELGFSSSIIIANNTVSTNSWHGISVYYSSRITIAGNTALISGNGIFLGYSSNNTVTGNILSSNKWHGITIYSSSQNTIAGNTISSNDGTGVYFALSSDNTLANNTVSSNDPFGIYLEYSNDISIIRNNVSLNNNRGIYLWNSNDILVHCNSIIDNVNQAYDNNGNENFWDNGYPSGGNYWSDYMGTDQFSGQDQDQPGSDGIGDEPYPIDADSRDRYPLMCPCLEIPPRPPTILDAALSGRDFENVTLSWPLSPDDGMGFRSVVGYTIYRNMTFYPGGLGYHQIAFLPNGTSTFTDNFTGEGDPNNYFYRVCAVDSHSNIVCAKNQAGKFTRPLSHGPNLVSIPLIQSNESVERVLQTLKYDKAWVYDSFSQEWKWYMTFKNYRRDLWNVNHTLGLWLNVTGECNLTVAGVVPASTSIHLALGWNLVGFPSFNSAFSVWDLKATVGSTRVEGFDPSPLPHCLRVLEDTEVLQAGYGHWVRVETETIWTIDA